MAIMPPIPPIVFSVPGAAARVASAASSTPGILYWSPRSPDFGQRAAQIAAMVLFSAIENRGGCVASGGIVSRLQVLLAVLLLPTTSDPGVLKYQGRHICIQNFDEYPGTRTRVPGGYQGSGSGRTKSFSGTIGLRAPLIAEDNDGVQGFSIKTHRGVATSPDVATKWNGSRLQKSGGDRYTCNPHLSGTRVSGGEL
eukprot:3881566-Rhodomonas_salina.1